MDLSPTSLARLPDEPAITVVMAVRNEAAYVGSALKSVTAQHYPAKRIEVVIADGGSTDGTRDAVMSHAHELRLRVLSNTTGTYAAGLNVALSAATGQVIVKLDGHSELDPNYLRTAIDALTQEGIAAVGPRIRTRGRGVWGGAIAVALSHPLVVGGADFRYAGPRRLTSSLAFAAYRREVFDRVGLFREDIGRAEDLELHRRILDAKGTMLLLAETLATYWCREHPLELARQYFQSGRDMAREPRAMRPYQAAPAAAIAIFAVFVVLALVSAIPATIPVVAALLYGVVPAIVAGRAAARSASAWRAAAATMIAHGSQALGWWSGVIFRQRPSKAS